MALPPSPELWGVGTKPADGGGLAPGHRRQHGEDPVVTGGSEDAWPVPVAWRGRAALGGWSELRIRPDRAREPCEQAAAGLVSAPKAQARQSSRQTHSLAWQGAPTPIWPLVTLALNLEGSVWQSLAPSSPLQLCRRMPRPVPRSSSLQAGAGAGAQLEGGSELPGCGAVRLLN